ncbi:MAG: hypothetical protein QOK11_3862 [Pseudonocardiales bacterium]|nr:hypothetical protein [Pseudonocardiales bacterium]
MEQRLHQLPLASPIRRRLGQVSKLPYGADRNYSNVWYRPLIDIVKRESGVDLVCRPHLTAPPAGHTARAAPA